DSTSQFLDRLDWIFLVKINDLGSLSLRHFKTGRNRVYSDDSSYVKELRASHAKLSHRAKSEYGDGIAGFDLRIFNGHVCGGNYVRQKNRPIVIDLLGQLHQSYI